MFSKQDTKDAKALARTYGFVTLLAKPESNPKIAKNQKLGLLTAPLHLAPHTLASAKTVCPWSTASCRAVCLHTAGNPVYMAGKNRARIGRTRFFQEQRHAFAALLYWELAALERSAERKGMATGARLDATSDLGMAILPLFPGRLSPSEAFPNISFYDYTKGKKRFTDWLQGHASAGKARARGNYHLTYSHAGDVAYSAAALALGGNVAAVFRDTLPSDWQGFPVANGDASDYRPMDAPGSVIGLVAKGMAKTFDAPDFVL